MTTSLNKDESLIYVETEDIIDIIKQFREIPVVYEGNNKRKIFFISHDNSGLSIHLTHEIRKRESEISCFITKITDGSTLTESPIKRTSRFKLVNGPSYESQISEAQENLLITTIIKKSYEYNTRNS